MAMIDTIHKFRTDKSGDYHLMINLGNFSEAPAQLRLLKNTDNTSLDNASYYTIPAPDSANLDQ